MKRFLLSISLCLLLSGCATSRSVSYSQGHVLRVWTTDTADSMDGQYRLYVKMQQMELSGICVMVRSNGTIRGTVVNEFGIRAFDFEDNGRRCRLKNCMRLIDKFFIRRGIGSDLHFLLRADELKAVRKADSITSGKRVISINKQGETVARCGNGTREYILIKLTDND